MSNLSTATLLSVLVFSGFFTPVGSAQPRNVLDLDGVWKFSTDPDNKGEADKWYKPDAKMLTMPLPGYAPTAKGEIMVPGIWINQGYGRETDKLRHLYVGKGWYKREVAIPNAWQGRRRFLTITGIHRYSKVWIDEHLLGEHIGFLSTQEYDVTEFAVPGKTTTITIQVDSKQRWEIDPMFGCSSLADFLDIEWGGIWGHVFLEARSNVWLSDLYVQPDVPNSACSVSATVNGKADLPDTAEVEIFDKDGQSVAKTTAKLDGKVTVGQPVSVKVSLPDASLWTPDTPTLYTARLALARGDRVLDTVESRFGMRQFTIDGPYLLLNGKRLMLRGYGDDHTYPEQMAMPSDKELHLQRLRIIKSYGFNHVRHHSTIMPPEYYDACDELGIIANAEFPIAYRSFVPVIGENNMGAQWKLKVKAGTDSKPGLDTYYREWAAAIVRHRNHPSIMCWVMGNELYNGLPFRKEFHQIVHQYDSGRFFVDSDGITTKIDRDTLDLHFFQFDVFSNPIESPHKFRLSEPPTKPGISHEEGNYVTFSRTDLIDQFKHNFKPFWLNEGRAKLKKLGLFHEADKWAEQSERLFAFLHKYNLESLRKHPYISGYHWWLFQDYWTTSNGIVDHYFRPKSITKEEVRQYNNDVVLLQDGLERTYRGKTQLELKLLVSNFSPVALEGALSYEVKTGEQMLVKKQLALKPVPQGQLSDVVAIAVDLPDVPLPVPLKIGAILISGNRRYENDWSTRLYPAAIKPRELSTPVYADDTQLKRLSAWGVKAMPAEGELPSRAVYVTSRLDKRALDAVSRGACVVMLDGAGTFLKTRPLTFRTSWWKAGESLDKNMTGTFVYDNPVTHDMAPDGWCDDGWFHLLEGGKKFDVEQMPERPDVMIRALPSMLVVMDEAVVFEVGIGKGSLIVSGLNHCRAADRPENEWLIARLLDRAAQFAQPKAKWPASFLTIVSVASEGSLPGFRRLVANEGEDLNWFSYREDKARVLVCRQTKPGNRVTWETAPVPKDSTSNRVTFVFAGSLGFGSEPRTGGFVLEINGNEVLRFDLPEPKIWLSADKRVELRFDSRRTVSVDQFGVFHLSVPRDMFKPGEPCVLSVRSLGTGSQRWFGLNPYW